MTALLTKIVSAPRSAASQPRAAVPRRAVTVFRARSANAPRNAVTRPRVAVAPISAVIAPPPTTVSVPRSAVTRKKVDAAL